MSYDQFKCHAKDCQRLGVVRDGDKWFCNAHLKLERSAGDIEAMAAQLYIDVLSRGETRSSVVFTASLKWLKELRSQCYQAARAFYEEDGE